MAFRILADENVELATVEYLRTAGNDVERIVDVPELGLGAEDQAIARYARQQDRLILTQDDDFFTELDVADTAGVCFQRDQSLSASEVGAIVETMAQYLDQSDVTLEYVSSAWL